MKYKVIHNKEFNELISKSENKNIFDNVLKIIGNLNEHEIIDEFHQKSLKTKSISISLTKSLENCFFENNWETNVPIYIRNYREDELFIGKRWTVDFYKDHVSIEIAFNHEEGTAWNIIKGYIASKDSQYKKNINTNFSIIITVTNSMKSVGGFDSSIASFEKYEEYLESFSSIMEYPTVLIGLEAPKTFRVEQKSILNHKKGYLRIIEREGR